MKKFNDSLERTEEHLIEEQLWPLFKDEFNELANEFKNVTKLINLIVEKEVDIKKLRKSKSVDQYNKYRKIKLSLEEFNYLKEKL